MAHWPRYMDVSPSQSRRLSLMAIQCIVPHRIAFITPKAATRRQLCRNLLSLFDTQVTAQNTIVLILLLPEECSRRSIFLPFIQQSMPLISLSLFFSPVFVQPSTLLSTTAFPPYHPLFALNFYPNSATRFSLCLSKYPRSREK